MSRGALLALAWTALALLRPLPSVAQTCAVATPAGTCTATTSTTMTAGSVMQLTLGAVTTTLTAPGLADYDSGYVADTGPSVTVRSNRAWQMQIHSDTATWSASGALARSDKPRADLQWSTSSGGSFVGLAGTSAPVTSGSATGGTAAQIHYRTLYDWTADSPGTYTLTAVFTLTTN